MDRNRLLAVQRLAMLVTLLLASIAAYGETWKTVTFRQSDNTPVLVDTDYFIERGSLIEIRAKYKTEKNLFNLLLPAGDVEERYLLDCDAKKAGLVYRKTMPITGNSTVDVDMVPSSVVLVDVPANTMLSMAVAWGCAEQKQRAAAKQPAKAAVPSVTPPSAPTHADQQASSTAITDDALTRVKWKLLSKRAKQEMKGNTQYYDAYVSEDVASVGTGLFAFLARYDYFRDEQPTSSVIGFSVSRWGVGCDTRKVLMFEEIEFLANGSVSNRYTSDPTQKPIDIVNGTVGQLYLDYACKGYTAKNPTPAERGNTVAGNLSFGTAWLSDRGGYFVTAFHVIDGAQEVALMARDGKTYTAKVAIVDKPNDIAILSSSAGAGITGLSIAKSTPGLGAKVFTIGYPHPDVMGVSQKLTSGDVSSRSGVQDDPRLLQISAPVQSGNSGGPLINMNGEVVGLISAKLSASQMLGKTGDLTQNVNYALKARYVAGLLDDLSSQPTASSQARIGRASTLEDLATSAQNAVFLVVGR